MSYYSVAGNYSSLNLPDSGFIAQNTLANVQQMGYDCLQAYLNHGEARQMWRQVNQSHPPETCWYQGAFATSAPNIAATYASCEAFLQLGAYKFKTPSGLAGLGKSSVKIKFNNGGAIVCYQSAGNQSANNKLWKDDTSLQDRTFNTGFSAVTSLGTVQQIAQAPTDYYDIAQQGGTPRGVRDLWGFSGTTRDGAIPTFTGAVTNDFSASSSLAAEIAAKLDDGVWIVPWFNATISGSSNYRPSYWSSNNGYWGCASVWGVSLEVSFE